ncbi:MAG: hypothetical protein V1870_00115 [Candidatus Aenigmatarchaeota archaeon]
MKTIDMININSRHLLKVILLLMSLVVILSGYVMLIPLLLAVGLIMLDKSVIMSTRYASKFILEITSFAVVMIGLIYGYIIGFLFAAIVPIVISLIAYSIIKQGKGITEMNVIFSSENIALVIVAVLASFLSFLPFVIAVLLLVGLKHAIVAVKDLMFGRVPNLIAFFVTLIVVFYLIQFLQSYVVQIAGLVV